MKGTTIHDYLVPDFEYVTALTAWSHRMLEGNNIMHRPGGYVFHRLSDDLVTFDPGPLAVNFKTEEQVDLGTVVTMPMADPDAPLQGHVLQHLNSFPLLYTVAVATRDMESLWLLPEDVCQYLAAMHFLLSPFHIVLVRDALADRSRVEIGLTDRARMSIALPNTLDFRRSYVSPVIQIVDVVADCFLNLHPDLDIVKSLLFVKLAQNLNQLFSISSNTIEVLRNECYQGLRNYLLASKPPVLEEPLPFVRAARPRMMLL